jgi:DNA repair exonuclease SbcCD ATPase subunit
MATVQMDMAELDALREQIKTQQKEIDEQKNELYEVRADKRVLKVTEYTVPTDINFSVDLPEVQQIIKRYGAPGHVFVKAGHGNNSNHLSSAFTFGDTSNLSYMLSRAIRVELIRDLGHKPKMSYVNLDDVKEELRKDFDEQYADELGQLRAYKANDLARQSELVSHNETRIKLIKQEHENYINKLQEDRDRAYQALQERYSELEKQYKELETGKKEQSEKEELMAKILELEAKLAKKSWFNF